MVLKQVHSPTLLNFFKSLDPRPRLGLSSLFGMVIFLLLPKSMHLDNRILVGWISGALCFLSLILIMFLGMTPQQTRQRAQRQETEHLGVFLLVILTALISVFAIALMLSDNKNIPAVIIAWQLGLSVVAILCSWFLTHTMFALHYAALYYRPTEAGDGVEQGLDFVEDDFPDYLDFIYYSFVIGMTFQVSDVAISSRTMRRFSLGHELVAFFYYTVIIAVSVNVVSGLI